MGKILDALSWIFGVIKTVYDTGNLFMDKIPFLQGPVAKNVAWIVILAVCYHFMVRAGNSPESPVRRFCEALAVENYEKAIDQCIYGDTCGDDEGTCLTREELKIDRRTRAMILSRFYDETLRKVFASYRIVGVDPLKIGHFVEPRTRYVRVELSDGKFTLTPTVYKCDNGKWKILEIGKVVGNTGVDSDTTAPVEKRSDKEKLDKEIKLEEKADDPLWLRILNGMVSVVKFVFVLGLIGGGLVNLCQWLKRKS